MRPCRFGGNLNNRCYLRSASQRVKIRRTPVQIGLFSGVEPAERAASLPLCRKAQRDSLWSFELFRAEQVPLPTEGKGDWFWDSVNGQIVTINRPLKVLIRKAFLRQTSVIRFAPLSANPSPKTPGKYAVTTGPLVTRAMHWLGTGEKPQGWQMAESK